MDNITKLLAEILAAAQSRGHNDAPLFEDYSIEGQERFIDDSKWILKVLKEYNYIIINNNP